MFKFNLFIGRQLITFDIGIYLHATILINMQIQFLFSQGMILSDQVSVGGCYLFCRTKAAE